MKLVLFGPPGSGKGTQAEILSAKLNIPIISTGDIIRNAIKNQTPIAAVAKGYIDKGNLLPDDIVIEIIKERLGEDDCKSGFILDGFPRTVAQADALYAMNIIIDKVLFLEVEDDVIIRRLVGRRQCLECGDTYHVTDNPPKLKNHCDKCGSELAIRDDDRPETVLNRLDVYHNETQPLMGYYNLRHILFVAYGSENVADTTKEVQTVLGLN